MIHQQNTAHRNAPVSTTRSSASADASSLILWPLFAARTVSLNGRQTRLRLEAAVWEGLDDIAAKEGKPVMDLCRELDDARPSGTPLTSAVRNYVLAYFRSAGSR